MVSGLGFLRAGVRGSGGALPSGARRAAARPVGVRGAAGGRRVRSHRRLRNRGTESVSKSSIKRMPGSTKRQCDRTLGGCRHRDERGGEGVRAVSAERSARRRRRRRQRGHSEAGRRARAAACHALVSVGLPIDFLPAERVAHNARLPDLVRLARGESVI